MIIAVAATKGGAGKSTTAINLSVLKAKEGQKICLIDSDLQGTARDWMATRENWLSTREMNGNETPIEFMQVTGKQTFEVIQSRAGAFDSVIVDCGGRHSAELQLSLAAADLIVVPVQPSNADSWAFADTMEAIKRARAAIKHAIPTAAFVSRGSTNTKDREAADLLAYLRMVDMENFHVLTERTSERKVYRDALAAGQGVIELEPRTKKEAPAIEKAKAELMALHKALMALLPEGA